MTITRAQHPSFRILNTEPSRFSRLATQLLGKIASVDEIESDRQYLLEHAANYDCLFICLRNVIDKEILNKARRLKYIVTPTTGLNHIDVKHAEQLGIKVLSLKGETDFLKQITATAELTWGLLLNLARNILPAHQSVMNNEWLRNNFYGTELRELTLGILGMGRLGSMVATYGNAFGMKVLAHDLEREPRPGIDFVSFDELLAQADVLTIHLSLNPDTHNFFNAQAFEKLKKGAIFINTSRGEVVDENALVKALKSGHIAAAAVDVISGEVSDNPDWLKQSALYQYAQENKNLLITPHIGGVTHQSVEKTNLYMINKLSEFLNQEGAQ